MGRGEAARAEGKGPGGTPREDAQRGSITKEGQFEGLEARFPPSTSGQRKGKMGHNHHVHLAQEGTFWTFRTRLLMDVLQYV